MGICAPVTAMPPESEPQQIPISADGQEFKYTQQYFDYHRNMVLFFGGGILVTWLGLSLDVEKIAYISGNKELVRHWLPWALLALGVYNATLFIPEWHACAGPHWLKIRSVSLQLVQGLNELHSTCEHLKEMLPNQVRDAESKRSDVSRDQVRALMKKERENALDQINGIIQSQINDFQKAVGQVIQSLRSNDKSMEFNKNARPDISTIVEPVREISQEGYDPKADEIIVNITNYFDNYSNDASGALARIIDMTKNTYEHVRRTFMSNSVNGLNALLTEKDVHKWTEDTLKSNSELAAALDSKTVKIENLMKSARWFKTRTEAVPWVKVYLGGVLIPCAMFFAALIGAFKHEHAFLSEIEAQKIKNECPFDLTLSQALCRLNPQQP